MPRAVCVTRRCPNVCQTVGRHGHQHVIPLDRMYAANVKVATKRTRITLRSLDHGP